MKSGILIEQISASELFEKLEELKAAAPVDEREIIGQYWQEFSRKDAALIIGCSPTTLDKIATDHPEKIRPNAKGKYPLDMIFKVKNIGWKNLRTT